MAPDIQNTGLVRQFEVIEDPTLQALGVGAEAFVRRDGAFNFEASRYCLVTYSGSEYVNLYLLPRSRPDSSCTMLR
jgi:hypothetical protein